MKNSECIIKIVSDNGFVQTFHQVKSNKWIQTTHGVEREATSEQLLSHILPLLAEGNKGNFRLEVLKQDNTND